MDSTRRPTSSTNHTINRRSRNAHAHRRASDDPFTMSSRRSKSRSPSRVTRNDPYAALNASMTATKISTGGNRSSKSSGSASVRQSTSSYDTDIITDPGQRMRSSITTTSFQRQNGSRPSTPAASASNSQRKDKGKSKSHGSADVSFSGPLAAAEFERMRNEIESLKNILNEQKRNAKKQTKKIDELKAEVVSGKARGDEQEAQFQLLKSKHSRNEELLNTFEMSLTCNICMELLNKPFSLSPCGHTFCMQDLQEWFRKAPPTDDDMDVDTDDPDYILFRQKTCPACRAIVIGRPLPVYLVRDLVGALRSAKASGDTTGNISARRSSSPYVSEDPWDGLFPNDDDEEEYEDDDEDQIEVAAMPFGFLYSESDSEMEMHEDDSEYDSNGELGEEEERSIVDEDEQERESGEGEDEEEGYSESDADDAYISPQWEPPCYPYIGGLAPGSQSQLARRGCPPWLSSTYRMRYSHNSGLVAHFSTLNPDDVGPPPHGSTSRMHRLFLGWNIRNLSPQSSERSQRLFIAQILEDFRSEPFKFSINQRTNGCLDVRVLVRADEVTHYDTTESEIWDE